METLTLNATTRTITGKQVKQLRNEKKLPAVIYGKNEKNRDITIDAGEFEKVFRKAGESTLVDLVVDGADSFKVLIQDVQRDPLLDRLTHADLRQVNMKEKLTLKVQLKFVGEAPAIKELGAILVRNLDEIEVTCLPTDLVHEIEVSLLPLKNFNDTIRVKDLVVPKGIEIKRRPEDIIVIANEPMSEEELKALEEKPVEDVTAVKVETEEKKAAKEAEATDKDKKEEKK